MSPKSTVLLNKVARLHDPESRALDDLPGLVHELRDHLTTLEGHLDGYQDLTTPLGNAWSALKALEPAWRRNAIIGSLPSELVRALDALLPKESTGGDNG